MQSTLIIIQSYRTVQGTSDRGFLLSTSINMQKAIALLLCLSIVVIGADVEPRGIQLRVTQKGLDYTINEAVNILKGDIAKMKLKDFSGKSSGVKFTARNLHLKRFNIGSNSLRPDYGKGLQAAVSGVSLALEGEIKYEKKVGWFKIRDTVGISADASGISFSLSLRFGRSPTGHPTVDVNWCRSNVDHLKIHFSKSSVSWLYNLLSGFVERSLKKTVADLMCNSARESIRKRGKEELAEFQVRKPIDKYAILDYSLSVPPSFKSSFMDIFVRGEFLERKNPKKHSSLQVPSFEATADNKNMLYFWLTDYTLNTAGEVYHNAGLLALNITQKSRIPWLIKRYLNTKQLGNIFRKLNDEFPDRPVWLHLHSYKPPMFEMKRGQATLFLFAAVDFKVVLKNGQTVNLFTLNLDVSAAVSPRVTAKEIKGTLNKFTFKMKIAKWYIKPLKVSSQLGRLSESLIEAAIFRAAKAALNKGLPLPNLNEVHLTNPGVLIMPKVIRISTDFKYIRKKH